NLFAVESFLDELAHHQKRDPLELRLALLRGDPRAQKVLTTVAERADWHRPRAPGRHVGIAFCDAFGTYLAHVVELSVAQDAAIAPRTEARLMLRPRCIAAIAAMLLAAPAAGADPSLDEALPQFAVAGPAGFGLVSADGRSMLATHWLLETDFASFLGADSPA